MKGQAEPVCSTGYIGDSCWLWFAIQRRTKRVTHSAAGTGGTPVSPSLALDGETGVPARPEDADAPSTHQSSVTRRHLLGSGAQIAIALRSTTSLSCAPLGGRGRPPLRGRRDPGCGGFASV